MRVCFQILETPELGIQSAIGRNAWALLELQRVGDAGCTPITHPGPRWSGYVHKLRKRGLRIETVTERHGGPFPGHHARYVLRSKIQILFANADPAVAGDANG
jgi:hypothetical protein